jgi:chromosome partitioning protein
MKTPIKIAIINEKGGVAKTTSTINIASYLAYNGKKVLVLDLDKQANATSTLFKRKLEDDEKSIYDLLISQTNASNSSYSDKDLKNSFIKRRKLETDKDCYIDFIPSHRNLADIEVNLNMVINRERALSRLYNKYKKTLSEYDYILVDCPPSLGLVTINAFVACNYLLVPVDGSQYAKDGIEDLIDTLGKCKLHYDSPIEILGMFCTRFMKNENNYKETHAYLVEEGGWAFIEHYIRKCTAVESAPRYNKTVLEHAPSSSGAADYNKLSGIIIQRVEELQSA